MKNIEFRKASLEDNLQELSLLINEVYKDAEDGMWRDDYCRISNEELSDLIQRQEIYIALADSKIIASIPIYQKSKSIFRL